MFPLTFQVTVANTSPDTARLAQRFSFVADEARHHRSKMSPT